MTQQPANPAEPQLNLRGAVDLSALAARRPPAAPPPGAGAPAGGEAAPSAFVVDVTDDDFGTAVLPRSHTVPIVLDFWASWCGPCRQLSPILEALAAEYGGRLLLGKVDVDANPQLAAAFQVQSIPTVYAVLKGQPVPLFTGAMPEQAVRRALEELLRVAEANGVAGTLSPEELGAPPEPVEVPLPAAYQEAYDAIERDDLDAAAAAFQKALDADPGDEEARLGLAQVNLLQRVRGADPAAARAAAAAAPADVAAQTLVADLDVIDGRVEEAFARLVDLVRLTSGEDRDAARQHLVGLFGVVGDGDPRVVRARAALASALF